MNAADRFFSRVMPAADGSGCLLWTGALSTEGYGRFSDRDRLWQAHRWILSRALPEPIPSHLDVDHLCRNRACVRPAHLEIVTRSENIRRGLVPSLVRARAAAVTHCPQGHPYDEENTYIYVRKDGARTRHCKACDALQRKTPESRAYHREYQRQLRASRPVFTVIATAGDNGPEVEVIWHRKRPKAVAA